MKKIVLDFLSCPKCQGNLDMEITHSQGEEIIEGVLLCKCNARYKISRGIPRMVYPSDSIENSNDAGTIEVQKSFEQEWKNFNVSDKTWGFDIEERKEIFLSDMNILDKNTIRQKVLLDAGCGNGTLTIGLADFGLEVIGIDLTSSVDNAYQWNTNPHVNFVQGNIMYPPFKKNMFDLIYSSGVIHHTPNPEQSFRQLSSLVKESGKLFVWVYGGVVYEKAKFYKLFLGLHVLTSRLPLIIQDLMYSFIAIFFQIVQFFINIGKTHNQNKMWDKNWSERKVWVHDILSHRYQSLHSREEVTLWFKKENFSGLTFTDRLKWGFGICGIKQKNL